MLKALKNELKGYHQIDLTTFDSSLQYQFIICQTGR